jgi:hypothetical protein
MRILSPSEPVTPQQTIIQSHGPMPGWTLMSFDGQLR